MRWPDEVLKRCRVIAGLGLVENAYDETGLIAAVAPEDFFEREKQLLQTAKKWMPRLPFPKADLLIVDQIGKDISGSGMDTNVIGRKYSDHAATDKDSVAVKRIFVRGLTEATHGNACGLGLSEFTNQRTINNVNLDITRINTITGGHPTGGMLPIARPTDRLVLEDALGTIGLTPPENARIIHISDTLHLKEVLVSAAFQDQFANRDDLEVLDGPREMDFDEDDNLYAVNSLQPIVH